MNYVKIPLEAETSSLKDEKWNQSVESASLELQNDVSIAFSGKKMRKKVNVANFTWMGPVGLL